ncbi:MAG: homocysteine S-methyltransferase family protein, partial [Ruminiclostridium sp.]|nr:homocysteine S-methyltransferase family protein [Ruminiclostridium sp.]
MMNFARPDDVRAIHRSYIEAGADIINANTFGANRLKLSKSQYTTAQVVRKALSIAREAVEGTDTLVALDIGPTGQLLEPAGTLPFEEAYEIFREIICAGKNMADLIFIETMTDLYEIKAALLAAKENSDLPVFTFMSFEKNGRTFTGALPSAAALTLTGLGSDAIGVNCSLAPDELYDIVGEMLRYTDLPVMVKANAGLPDPSDGSYSVSSEQYANDCIKYTEMGVKVYGGCCGTTPEYISRLKKMLSEHCPVQRGERENISSICSYSRTVDITCPRIIGERINPTGKKLFKEALRNKDINYILNQAIEQASAGADILDVNVGLPEIDEKEMMVTVVKALQGITDLPLQIDSTKPDVIEAALRVYNGKAIVNSINGENAVMERILPIVKKYGASVVGLTLDENGIPPKASQRVEIAEKIAKKAEEYGIPRRDVFIDCLTLTVSTEQKAVGETLGALREVRQRLGMHTVLGVSNISFGLPSRGLINSTFLSMAMGCGLDLPIINPNSVEMSGAVFAYRALASHDPNAAEFIARFGGSTTQKPASSKTEVTLSYAIEKGLDKEAEALTKQKLANGEDAMEIISGELIPALDRAGDDFGKNKIFLPQLIL